MGHNIRIGLRWGLVAALLAGATFPVFTPPSDGRAAVTVAYDTSPGAPQPSTSPDPAA